MDRDNKKFIENYFFWAHFTPFNSTQNYTIQPWHILEKHCSTIPLHPALSLLGEGWKNLNRVCTIWLNWNLVLFIYSPIILSHGWHLFWSVEHQWTDPLLIYSKIEWMLLLWHPCLFSFLSPSQDVVLNGPMVSLWACGYKQLCIYLHSFITNLLTF